MPDRYSRLQIVLHWVTAVLVVVQFLFHDPIAAAFDAMIAGKEAALGGLVALHIFSGFLIFCLVLVRLQQRLEHGVPALPDGGPAWHAMAARVAHISLYGVLVLLPVTGAIAWFRGSEGAGDAHEVLRALLLALIALHIGAACINQFVFRNELMRRMSWQQGGGQNNS